MGFLDRARQASERGSQKRVIKRNLSAADIANAMHEQAKPVTPTTPSASVSKPPDSTAQIAKTEPAGIPEKKDPTVSATPRPEPRNPAPAREETMKADYLGSRVRFEGTFCSDRDIEIDGQIKGSIELTGGSLTVGPNAKIEADVTSPNLVVAGDLNGIAKIAGRVEVRSTGTLRGELHTQSLFLEEGAVIDGIIRRGKSHS